MAETATVDEKLNNIDAALDEFEKSSGIMPNIAPGDAAEIEQYLTMNRERLSALDDIACYEIGYRILQYGMYVQRIVNRDKARITWAKTLLANYVTNDSDYDKFRKFEVSVEIVAKKNSAVARLAAIMRWAQQRMDRLEYMSSNLKSLSDMLTNMARSKKAESYEQKKYT